MGLNTIICGDTNIYKDEANPSMPLKDAGFTEAKSDENTAIHENVLSQRFDRFYLCRTLLEKVKGGEWIVDSRQESANGDYKDYARNVSGHFPVTLAVDLLN